MPRKGGKNPYQGDRLTKAAKDAGFLARSVFKLEEVQKRARFLAPGQRVVDLGCFPGSWSQYLLQVVGPRGVVVGVDLKAPQLGGGRWIEASVFDVTPARLLDALGGPADVVVSDMAPSTTGVAFADHARQIELARRALELATATLAPGGSFLVKVFDGEEVPAYAAEVRAAFGAVRRLRPEAVRAPSREFYLLATGFRGRAPHESG